MFACNPAVAQSLTLNLDDISGSGWSARQVRVSLQADGGALLAAGQFLVQGREFKDVSVECGRFVFDRVQIRCETGKLRSGNSSGSSSSAGDAAAAWPLELVYGTRDKRLQLSIAPSSRERWTIRLANGEARIELEQAEAARIAPLLLDVDITPNAGRVSGTLRYAPARVSTELTFTELGFADKAGLRAGEKLAGKLVFDSTREGSTWNWNGALDWNDGAVFWDPVYIASGGHRVEARGTQTDANLQVDTATLDWRGLGRLTGSLAWDRAGSRVQDYTLSARALTLTGLREFVPQAWAEQNQLTDLRLTGTADIDLQGMAGHIRQAALVLRNAGADAPQRALALENVNTEVRFAATGSAPFKLSLDALRLRGLAFGPVTSEGEMRDGRLTIPNLLMPVLNGVLALGGIEIDADTVRLQGALTPISMEKLAAALGWHPMGGELAFVLPQVNYAKSTLTVDGALLFKLFGGDALVEQIRLADPFGRTPRLTADVQLKRLNLEEMTSAVKFGTITGYLDVDVNQLVMENWQPQSMDAKVLTSAGDFRKRISQRAVQNISSIGGAGAGAAIQRSFLSFFDTFGYDKIGISCKLRNGICEMGGAGNASGGYALIKGGGVPAVNVVGYNRFVGWQELLDRIKAVIDGNSKIIIQ